LITEIFSSMGWVYDSYTSYMSNEDWGWKLEAGERGKEKRLGMEKLEASGAVWLWRRLEVLEFWRCFSGWISWGRLLE
jgi:hypothetical protein